MVLCFLYPHSHIGWDAISSRHTPGDAVIARPLERSGRAFAAGCVGMSKYHPAPLLNMPPWALLRASESRGRPLTSRPRDARGAARACRCALRGPRASRGRARTARLRAHRGTRGAPAAAHTAPGTASLLPLAHTGPLPLPKGFRPPAHTTPRSRARNGSRTGPGNGWFHELPPGGLARALPASPIDAINWRLVVLVQRHSCGNLPRGRTHTTRSLATGCPRVRACAGPSGRERPLCQPRYCLVVAAAPPSRLCVTHPLDGRHHHAPVRQKSKGAARAQSCHPGDRMLARVGAGRGAGEGIGVLPWAAAPSTAGDAAAHP